MGGLLPRERIDEGRRSFIGSAAKIFAGAVVGIGIYKEVEPVRNIVDGIEEEILDKKAKKITEEDKETIERYEYIELNPDQLNLIMELATVELNTKSYIKRVFSNKKVPEFLGLRKNIGTSEFAFSIPVTIKMGYILSKLIKRKDFIICDNIEKKFSVLIPRKVQRLSTDYKMDKAKVISQEEQVFANITPGQVLKELGISQKELENSIENQEELLKGAKEKSLTQMKAYVSLFTTKGFGKEGYKIEFKEMV